MRARRSERGAAMLLAMMATLLMTALGVALVLTSASEATIAGAYRGSEATRYAAEAAAERVLADLSLAGDWNTLLDGSARSTFVDGSPLGTRTLADGTVVDLDRQVNLANCGKTTACSSAEMNAVTADRPWGANNPRWKLVAYAPLSTLLPAGALDAPAYVAVLAGDDPSETDGDPVHDGADPANPGSGIIALRALAFGLRGAVRAIELTVSRPPGDDPSAGYNDRVRQTGVRVLSWREVR